MKSAYGFVIAVLGGLAAAPSVISILQREFAFGLVPALAGMVQFYRELLQPVGKILYAPLRPMLDALGWEVPVWLQELHVLSFIAASVVMRSLLLTADHRRVLRHLRGLVIVFTTTFLLGITFLALPALGVALFSGLFRWLAPRELSEDGKRGEALGIFTVQAVGATTVAVAAFYVTNLVAARG
jgi:hypothetical protein